MNQNVFVMYLRLMEVEVDFNRSMNALAQLAFVGTTTPKPFYTSTTQAYVRGNSEANAEINRLLNRLLDLRLTKGLAYLAVMKTDAAGVTPNYSSDPDIDAEVRQIFAKLMVYAKMYNLSFRKYLARLEEMPTLEKKCSLKPVLITVVCISKFLTSLRTQMEHCCSSLTTNTTTPITTNVPRAEL